MLAEAYVVMGRIFGMLQVVGNQIDSMRSAGGVPMTTHALVTDR